MVLSLRECVHSYAVLYSQIIRVHCIPAVKNDGPNPLWVPSSIFRQSCINNMKVTSSEVLLCLLLEGFCKRCTGSFTTSQGTLTGDGALQWSLAFSCLRQLPTAAAAGVDCLFWPFWLAHPHQRSRSNTGGKPGSRRFSTPSATMLNLTCSMNGIVPQGPAPKCCPAIVTHKSLPCAARPFNTGAADRCFRALLPF